MWKVSKENNFVVTWSHGQNVMCGNFLHFQCHVVHKIFNFVVYIKPLKQLNFNLSLETFFSYRACVSYQFGILHSQMY